jgi:hypothetical protein
MTDQDRIVDLESEVEFLQRQVEMLQQRVLRLDLSKDIAQSRASLAATKLAELNLFARELQFGDPNSAFNKFAAKVEQVADEGYGFATGRALSRVAA